MVHQEPRLPHDVMRTEEAYVGGIRHTILVHGKRHLGELGPAEITAILTHLSADERVAASTQNQSLADLL